MTISAKNDYHIEPLLSEWRTLVEITQPEAHALLISLSDDEVRYLVDRFYDYMLNDEHAHRYLTTRQVTEQLSISMFHWLRSVLGSSQQDLAALLSQQHHVGVVHARIGLPIDLVARGARKLKNDLYPLLTNKGEQSPFVINSALCFSGLAMDTALEAMTIAYSPTYKNAMRDQERYRVLSVYDDVSVERERQLGALMNWENQFIYHVATELPLTDITLLGRSEFGLWFSHKGKHLFGFPELLRETETLIDNVDREIGSISPEQLFQAEERMRLLRNVRQLTGQITLIITAMFDELVKFENGKDPLTNLLNRRFIPTIMRREIALATSTQKPFTLVMMDVDHFKQVNDRYGHDTGDATLKSISAMIYDHVRSSDYVFRYGGEEFMVLLVETTLRQAKVIVDTLRQKVAATSISAFGSQSFSVTLSIGVAEFDYHPDYQQLINKADVALYQAKVTGRNRVELHE